MHTQNPLVTKSTQAPVCNPLTLLLAPAQTQTHQKRNAVVTCSQPPLPRIRSGRLTGQTMYNSATWTKIVLFRPSLLDGGGGGGGVRAAKGVGTVTSALVKSRVCLWLQVPGQSLGEGGSFKSPLQGSLPKLRGPSFSFPHSHPNILQPGEAGSPKGQLGEQSGELHRPPQAAHTCWGLESPPHVSDFLTLPQGPGGEGHCSVLRHLCLRPPVFTSPINQLISPQIFTEHSPG